MAVDSQAEISAGFEVFQQSLLSIGCAGIVSRLVSLSGPLNAARALARLSVLTTVIPFHSGLGDCDCP